MTILWSPFTTLIVGIMLIVAIGGLVSFCGGWWDD